MASFRNTNRRSSPLTFFANPFVVLVDVMVSLVFIVSLFMVTRTMSNEQIRLIAERDERRSQVQKTLEQELPQLLQQEITGERSVKVDYGHMLEIENDGSLQRFRFLTALRFAPGKSEKDQAFLDEAMPILRAFGRTLLLNRKFIKAVSLEGHATPLEANKEALLDGHAPLPNAEAESKLWELSERRAETVRKIMNDEHFFFAVPPLQKQLKLPAFLKAHLNQKTWDKYSEWSRQEYQARSLPFNAGLGSIPSAWVISSGRGDQLRQDTVVEFKVEYTDRSPLTYDSLLKQMANARQLTEAEQLTAQQYVLEDAAQIKDSVELAQRADRNTLAGRMPVKNKPTVRHPVSH